MLPHAASSAPVARRRLIADLATHGIGRPALDDAALVLAEMVGNAVRHGSPLAGGTLDVTWAVRRDDVELRVTDGGGGTPTMRTARDRAETGRGLAIVDAIAASWGVDHPRDGGTSVWARVAR